jgi:protein-disulfide isomerase
MPGEERAVAEDSRVPTGLVLCRVAVLVALLASSALYVHYLSPADSGLCGLHSGCEDVRRSALSYFQSRFLSMPLVGLVAYASVLSVSLLRPSGRELPALAGIGGLLGLALLAAQAFYVRAFCWLCTIVDASAIVAAAAALAHARSKTGVGFDPLRRGAWVALAVLAVLVPIGWTVLKPAPPVPAVILRQYVAGKINVVEFADFECPFCRKLHPVLKRAMAEYPAERVHFVRKHVPLEAHEMALPAARAAVCGEAQGKGEALADRLIDIELSAAGIRRAAVGAGVDVVAFDRCLASNDPERRISADRKLLEDAGMEGLPTTYIGPTRILGVVSEAALRDALDRAARNEGTSGLPAPVYAVLAAAALAATAWLGRSRRRQG